MKHLLFLITFLNLNAFAQDERMSMSAHIGYCMSNTLFSETAQSNFCYNAGIELRHRLGVSNFFLQSGIRWNEYGFQDMHNEYIVDGSNTIVNRYMHESTIFLLSIPIITTYKLKSFIPGLTISAGPQLSFYMFSKSEGYDDVIFSSGNYAPTSLSFHTSVGYEYAISEKWIFGAEVNSNFNFPIGWFFGSEGEYNCGLALTGRYILK